MMRALTRWMVVLLLPAFIGIWFSGVALADDGPALRVVVLPQVTLDGKRVDIGALERTANRALRDAGLRPISLDASLRAQAFALAESVEEGRIPDELSALNADAVWLVELACEATRVQAFGADETICSCSFDRGVRRGAEEVFSASSPWRGQCLGAQAGMTRMLETTIPETLGADIEEWLDQWRTDGRWDIDLLVTGLRDRRHARSLVERFDALPGVSSVRFGMFSPTATRYSFRGEGSDAALRLPEHIDDDESLGLVITHETDRLIHAELDFGRAYRRQARVLVVPPTDVRPKSPGAIVAEAASDLVRSAAANLRWLEMSELEVVGSSAGSERDDLMGRAEKAGEPFVKVVSFRETDEGPAKDRWLVSTSLIATGDGQEIITGTGSAKDALSALDASVRNLDQRFIAAASDRAQRRRLGLPDDAADDAGRPTLRIASFELRPLFPTRAREYRENGIGMLRLENATGSEIGEGRIEVRASGRRLSSIELPNMPPSGEVELPVLLESTPDLDPDETHRVQVEATVSFKAGDSYGRSRAYAPLLIHRRSALDWNEPASLAAFIDPTDPVVRALATRAIEHELPEAATSSLARASLVHAVLWHPPLTYVADPVTTAFDESIDDVQHPRQTLERLAGDCDDMTALMASLFESVGLATAIITTPGHVLLAIESGLLAGGHLLLEESKERFVEVDGALFVPVETTAIGVGFDEAWKLGAQIVARAGNDVEAFRTRDAWRRYPTVSMAADVETGLEPKEPDISKLSSMLPALHIPEAPPSDAPLAAPALAWLAGEREDGSIAAADACADGSAEACYNLAVMLVAEAGGAGSEGEGDAPLPALLVDALSLLPGQVVRMILDHGGLGMGDDQSEASGEASTRRRLENVLEQAHQRQAQLRERGETGRGVQIDPMGGRRGSPAAEPAELAPMFFFGAVEG